MRFLTSLTISSLVAIFLLTPWGVSLERLFYDSYFISRGVKDSGKEIVIVAIDEASFDELDIRWPWSRKIHSQLIDTLKQHGAKVLGFDLLFSESSTHEDDLALASSIDSFGNVVLVNEISQIVDPNHGFEMTKIVDPAPIEELTKSPLAVGFANMIFDEDGFVRGLKIFQEDEEAFSLKISKLYSDKIRIDDDFDEGKINFVGPTRTFETVSYYQALDPEQYLPKDFFLDKIVLVGFVLASQANISNSGVDQYPVPFSKLRGGAMPGVEIHANAIENFLNHSFVRSYDVEKSIWIGIFLGIVGGGLLLTTKPLYSFLIFILVVPAFCAFALHSFINNNLYFSIPLFLTPFVICYISSPIFHYFTARKEKAYIRKAFSKYLSPRLVTELIKNPEKLELGGEEREGTVMFLDIAGFTSLSESLNAKELVAFVNLYLGSFADIIIENDGMIDKYIGDCIMAVWGIPVFDAEHSEKAINAVLQIGDKLDELNSTDQKLNSITFRVGITSGNMLAGNVGGGTQFNYTVLGNEVNLSSRLEALNKYWGTITIVSQRAAERVGKNYIFRKLDVVKVKGQDKGETIFELIGRRDEVSKKMEEGLAAFDKASELYLAKKWGEAIDAFKRVQHFIEDDGPSRVFIDRCQQFMISPPPDSWDGIFVMTEK